jgi:hypothetical protein
LPHNLCDATVPSQELGFAARHHGDASVYAVEMHLQQRTSAAMNFSLRMKGEVSLGEVQLIDHLNS